ncbi:hypothetical protein CT688_05410 [Dietzia sp. JS16-p6b]|nr:hypothetical protein CT688_05410 [Dietzia sp. JS16-p6b]QGW24159.1 outer membrane lipoprotein LolB [Dietzia sp. DQ12-45-1b]
MEEQWESVYATDGDKRVIRFFPDYGREHPLWESGTDKYAMDPEDYGLSESLSRRLAGWMRHWESNVIPETGWKSAEAAAESERVGDALVADLRIEVSGVAEVRDERRSTAASPGSSDARESTAHRSSPDHTLSMFVPSAIFMEGTLPPLAVGEVISVTLLFETDVPPSAVGVDTFHVTVHPVHGMSPGLDREGYLTWPISVAGDGWTARWLHHAPFSGRVRLDGRLCPDLVRALPGHPDTTTGRVRRLQLVEQEYENTGSGQQPVPGTERVSDPDRQPDHYWPDWRVPPGSQTFHPTGVLVDLDLDDVPEPATRFDAGAISVSGNDVWVVDKSDPVLLHIDTASTPPLVTEYLLPLVIEPPAAMWTRAVHADREGCWITAGDEIVRCDHNDRAGVTLRRVSTDGGDDTVLVDDRLFVLTYPGLTTQVTERYGALRGGGPDSFRVREVVDDELVPVHDETTIARARASSRRADIVTTPDGATWTAAGRVTVTPDGAASHTIDLHLRSPGRVRWIRPDARSGQGVDEIAVGSSTPRPGTTR